MMNVKLNLTYKEAEALLHAIGNSIDDAEDANALFENARQKQAAFRGKGKIINGMASARERSERVAERCGTTLKE